MIDDEKPKKEATGLRAKLRMLDDCVDVTKDMLGKPMAIVSVEAQRRHIQGKRKRATRPYLAIVVLAATAIPLPKVGQCPSGYASQAVWCVPMSKQTPVAVPKGKGQCPSTMMQSGQYCVEKH